MWHERLERGGSDRKKGLSDCRDFVVESAPVCIRAVFAVAAHTMLYPAFLSPAALLRLLAAIMLCGSVGCVHRRMTIESSPPGALVVVDGEEIGVTPASMDFTYYGTREIKLLKDGYETRTVQQPVATPWYQLPGLDFFSDNFAFTHIRDRHRFAYQLQPRRRTADSQGLLDRADSLRSESLLSGQ